MMKLCCEVLAALAGKTLATAESCTGGGIGAALTAVPGSSAVYKGGIISYTNWVKHHLLGVDEALLNEMGAVSAPVAEAMAQGARGALQSDVAVSVTGLAGPGGDEFGNPVGRVFIGYCDENCCLSRKYLFEGTREEIRQAAINNALKLILEQNSESNRSITMEKITSFTIDHIKLQPGLYVSRKDRVGSETVTTFDLRLTKPNNEPVMNTAEVHTIEHLAATYLRNDPQWKDKVLYFGPMGCRTGFYLLLAGDYASKDVVSLVLDCFRFIRDYRGEVPGASARDCGNYLDMNLPMANYWGEKYAALLENITPDRLVYPE